MTLAEHRAALRMTLEQYAVHVGLSASSGSWISEIENGKRDASLRLALRIERLSGGAVSAGSVCKELADHDASPDGEPGLPDAPASDDPTVAPSVADGAGKTDRNIPRTEAVS